MPKEIKLSSPLNEARELRRAAADLRRANKLAEDSAVRIFAVWQALKTRVQTREVANAVERLDRAHDQIGDARPALDDAAYQCEEILKKARQ